MVSNSLARHTSGAGDLRGKHAVWPLQQVGHWLSRLFGNVIAAELIPINLRRPALPGAAWQRLDEEISAARPRQPQCGN